MFTKYTLQRISIDELLEYPLFENMDVRKKLYALFLQGRYSSNVVDFVRNLIIAHKLFHQLGNLNDPLGVYAYGKSLERGYSGKKSFVEAMKYFKKEADLDHPYGICNYGVGLEYGYSGEKNFVEAMLYY
jgi:TPR repeat protein